MSPVRICVLLLAMTTGACALPGSVAPTTNDEGPWRFSGTISQQDGGHVGGPIAGARLRVIDGVNTDASTTSDGSGHYMLDNLTGGRFTVAIEAPGYVTATPVVELYGDVEVNFALERQ